MDCILINIYNYYLTCCKFIILKITIKPSMSFSSETINSWRIILYSNLIEAISTLINKYYSLLRSAIIFSAILAGTSS